MEIKTKLEEEAKAKAEAAAADNKVPLSPACEPSVLGYFWGGYSCFRWYKDLLSVYIYKCQKRTTVNVKETYYRTKIHLLAVASIIRIRILVLRSALQ